jgi:hypothetical protein
METFNGSASTLFQTAPVDIDAFVKFVESEGDRFPKGLDWVRDARQIARNWRERGVLFMPHGGGCRWEFVQQHVRSGEFQRAIGDSYDLDALGMYGFRGRNSVYVNSNFRRPGLDTERLAEYELEAQKLCYYVGGFLRRRMPGFEEAMVTNIGSSLGYRASRKIHGRERMLKAWLVSPTPVLHENAIGRVLAAVPPGHTDPCGDPALRANHTCDIPFGVIAPTALDNVLCGSGKSACQDEFILRNMPKCMTLGQAAGVAAALAAKQGIAAGDADIRAVQRELIRQGVDLKSAE